MLSSPDTVTLSSQGQISIPVRFREQIGIKPQDLLTITADPIKRTIKITRVKTVEEQLAEYDASLSPETKARFKQVAGKTTNQLRTKWDNSSEGQKYIQEKYFNAN
jgi:bifunctional DNA-binding transcriptional regulator/antitoxin component of YhaV-PrlF toxin-antitoxin module